LYTLVPASNLSQVIPFGAWYQLEFAFTPTASSFYVDNKLIASTKYARFIDGSQPLNLTLGGFDGFIDDVALSSAVRAPSQ
jgi:hypothetical protein